MKTIAAMLIAGFLLTSIVAAQDKPAAGVKTDPIPTLVKRADPKYPEAALKASIEGIVYVKALVNLEGKVAMAEVVKSDAKELDEAALEAARNFVFEAAKVGGQPVETWVTIPFKFKLAKEKGVKK